MGQPRCLRRLGYQYKAHATVCGAATHDLQGWWTGFLELTIICIICLERRHAASHDSLVIPWVFKCIRDRAVRGGKAPCAECLTAMMLHTEHLNLHVPTPTAGIDGRLPILLCLLCLGHGPPMKANVAGKESE